MAHPWICANCGHQFGWGTKPYVACPICGDTESIRAALGTAIMETWQCDYCGRANWDTTLSCEGCGASKPEAKSEPADSSVMPIMEFGNPEPVGWIGADGKIIRSGDR